MVCYRRAGRHHDCGPHTVLRSLMPVTSDLSAMFCNSSLFGRTDGQIDGQIREEGHISPPPPPVPQFLHVKEEMVTCSEKSSYDPPPPPPSF